MGEKKVQMTHPKLPGRTIEVRPGAVKSRERAGWKLQSGQAPASTTKKES